MIFTSLGLLLVSFGLLIAGIAKSSVALLMASLACTVAGGVVLAMVLPATRKLAAATAGGAPVAPANGQPVVLYVQQAPPQANAPELVAGPTAPIVGYDEMTAQQITALISSGALTDAQLQTLREYESTHAGRKSVLAKLP